MSISMMSAGRNGYGALSAPDWVVGLLRDVEIAGAWESGIESDKRGRGSAINVDIYGHDETRGLVVVQVRECRFRPGRYNRVRKDYYLCGRNENGNAFGHPLDVTARPLSLRSPEAAVRYVLARVWACAEDDLDDIRRNGDVAFVPVGRLPAGAELVPENAVTVRGGHHVRALGSGEVYVHHVTPTAPCAGEQCSHTYYVAGRAKIDHAKHQHPTARVRGGVWRVQAAERGSVWGFTAPTAD